jgi:dephospho-CoA kinase
MMKVGLTGNYGMGKSSVAAMFSRLGALTIDSDEIVASLLNEESVKGRIVGFLGVKALEPKGGLDKKYIAQRVFKNKALRKELEALIHPLVFHAVEYLMKKVRDRNRIIIVEVPLLFEGGYQNRFDRTITVYADRKTALSRLRKSGISREDALARLQNQMDIRTKKRLADYRIDNSGTRRRTEAQVKEIFSLMVNEKERVVSKGQRRS